MKKTLQLAFTLLLLAAAAVAAPCVTGAVAIPASPTFGDPVTIEYSRPGVGFLGPPTVSYSGAQITIDQITAIADPYPGGDIPCAHGQAFLGALPPGDYSVRVRLGSIATLDGLSLRVAPGTVTWCATYPYPTFTGPDAGTTAVSVRSQGGSVHLHFENEFFEATGIGAYAAPRVGPPLVTMEGHRITVLQTYLPYNYGSSGEGGPGSYAKLCQSEDVDLGKLLPGSYTLIWSYQLPDRVVSVTASFLFGSPRSRPSRR